MIYLFLFYRVLLSKMSVLTTVNVFELQLEKNKATAYPVTKLKLRMKQ